MMHTNNFTPYIRSSRAAAARAYHWVDQLPCGSCKRRARNDIGGMRNCPKYVGPAQKERAATLCRMHRTCAAPLRIMQKPHESIPRLADGTSRTGRAARITGTIQI